VLAQKLIRTNILLTNNGVLPQRSAKWPRRASRPLTSILTAMALAWSVIFAGPVGALALTQAPTSSPMEDKWAVVVGLSEFADPAVPKLKYSAKDAKDFSDYLTDPAGGKFKKDHVLLLLNKDATKVNIMDALGDSFLPHAAGPRDLVVIYLSTHGSPAGADPGGLNYVVAYDTQVKKLFATGIQMKQLFQQIRERVHTNRILLVMDTCYSGAGADEGHKGLVRTNIDSSAAAQGVGSLVISSSSPDQRSWESDDLRNSYFTRYFIDALKEGNGANPIDKVYKEMKDKVQTSVLKDKGELQTPIMAGIFSGPSLVLSSPPTINREAPIMSPTVTTGGAAPARGKGTGGGGNNDLSAYKEHKVAGAELYKQKKVWDAIHEYELATKVNPGTIEGYIVLAQLYDQQNRYPEMLTAATRAVLNDKDSSEGHEMLALANMRTGDPAEALRQAQRAVSLDPMNSMAHNVMGYINEHKFNKVDEAEQEYRKALELDALNTRALVNLGLLLEKQNKNIDEAETLFKKAIESASDDWEAHLALGCLLYYHRGNADAAEKEIRTAIELAPANARLHSELGNILALDKSRLEESEVELKKGIELSKEQGIPHYFMANFLLARRGRIDEAEKEYRKAIQMDPELADALVALGDLLVEHRHVYDESDALYKRALKANPKDAAAHLGLAKVQEKLFKNYSGAEQELKSALAIDPHYSLAYDRLGDLYTSGMGKHGDAKQAYQAAIESKGNNADANYHLGMLLWQQFHNPTEARKYLEKAISLDSTKSAYATAMGHLISSDYKEYKEAEQLLRKACDLNFADSDAHYYLGMLLIEKFNQRKAGEAELKVAYEQKPDDKQIKAAFERFVK
jgi:tetratricopeptide (TPR) repeat protein